MNLVIYCLILNIVKQLADNTLLGKWKQILPINKYNNNIVLINLLFLRLVFSLIY